MRPRRSRAPRSHARATLRLVGFAGLAQSVEHFSSSSALLDSRPAEASALARLPASDRYSDTNACLKRRTGRSGYAERGCAGLDSQPERQRPQHEGHSTTPSMPCHAMPCRMQRTRLPICEPMSHRVRLLHCHSYADRIGPLAAWASAKPGKSGNSVSLLRPKLVAITERIFSLSPRGMRITTTGGI